MKKRGILILLLLVGLPPLAWPTTTGSLVLSGTVRGVMSAELNREGNSVQNVGNDLIFFTDSKGARFALRPEEKISWNAVGNKLEISAP